MSTFFKKQDYGEPPLRSEICDLINPNTKVLDVGCASGKLGAALKNKGCFRVGIEIDVEFAEKAKVNYDRLLIVDIEKLTKLPFPERYFDVMVFADILEHLAWPENVLSNLTRYLSDDGYIVLSVPNVANWQVRLGLLLGNFNYGHGILDGGHLRFFTLKSIKSLLESNGYRVVIVKTRNRVIKILGKLHKRLFAFQFVIKAVKVNSRD